MGQCQSLVALSPSLDGQLCAQGFQVFQLGRPRPCDAVASRDQLVKNLVRKVSAMLIVHHVGEDGAGHGQVKGGSKGKFNIVRQKDFWNIVSES